MNFLNKPEVNSLSILDIIKNNPQKLKELEYSQLNQLCGEIRSFLIEKVSKSGGHLASNLGVVELTVALHRVLNVEKDRLIFDVGHQSYVHKLLTGRMDKFSTLRSFGGISGFPKPCESNCDAFIAGHASNSISVTLGMARARTLSKEDYRVVCITGDGALTGGLSYEAMNDAGQSGEPMVVILNDNGMSITRNVGSVAGMLSHQRTKPAYYKFKKGYHKLMEKLPGGKHIYNLTHSVKTIIKNALLHCSIFEELGFRYVGPVDGHDMEKLIYFLNYAVEANEPVLVHVVTKKGKGYTPAEKEPDEYHGVGAFDPEIGLICNGNNSFSQVFGKELQKLAGENKKICAITAAMASGTGLSEFAREYPNRFFDVGIAEGHAVTMAAGMAKQNMIPVFAVYSTFLQRSYDMLIHDVAISKLHVVLAVDRAGIVGEDGETHHGVFDVGYLSQIPHMTVYSPSSYNELRDMLKAALELGGPVAIRYPRGKEGSYRKGGADASLVLKEGSDITLVGYGILINEIIQAASILEKAGINPEIVKLGQIAPLQPDDILASVSKTGRLVVVEDTVSAGSVGEKIAALLLEANIPVRNIMLKNLGASFVTHGSIPDLLKHLRLDGESVAADIMNEMFGV
ncbi:MAG: 1-deoxy-D-xylulose-5-phosphate synthase [Clostridiales bacterium]|jgi:1-deoxy-D-xylulose-5-phosphate synthase|nr:1-deoxy-D-xylulose-5-phosphate synthase [Clostridiales bacterium]